MSSQPPTAEVRLPRSVPRRLGRATWIVVLVVAAALVGGTAGVAAGLFGPSDEGRIAGDPGASARGGPSASALVTPSPSPTPRPTPSPSPSPMPSPTPEPTPVLVPAPLTGALVGPDAVLQHPIAVMIDDHSRARPQSGLSEAAVVWHAPAEGGIPRYMAIYQDTMPTSVGPIRSAREYYIAWAAEWRAVYVHVGGSPQALATLRSKGRGQLVFNADEFRWGGTYIWRIKERRAPHNTYTDGPNLRKLAGRLGADDGPLVPAWTFGPDALPEDRPAGGTIEFAYQRSRVSYAYDQRTNTYVRSVPGESPQVDASTGRVIAPKNVVVMLMRFGPLNDGHPEKHRLEAQVVGSGTAWIATNGSTIKGTWKKASQTGPTQFFDGDGRPVTLTVGQTFINVLQSGTRVTVKDGRVVVQPKPIPAGGASEW